MDSRKGRLDGVEKDKTNLVMVTKFAQTGDGGRSGRQRFTEKPHRGKSLISILQSLEWLLEKQFSYVSMINPEHLHIFWIYANY